MTEDTLIPVASPISRGFFGPDHSLFGMLHAAMGTQRDLGVVICEPADYEGIQTYRTMRYQAHRLAKVGIPTLRFQFHGTGESMGRDVDDGRVAAWRDSVDAAIDHLKAASGVTRVALLGVRLGATFAVDAAGRGEVAGLALWEPCQTGAMFAREMEIMSAGSRQSEDAQEDGDGSIETAGYVITAETQHDLRGVNAMKPKLQGHPDVLLVQRDDRPENSRMKDNYEKAGCDVTWKRLPGHDRMMGRPDKAPIPMQIVREVTDWLGALADGESSVPAAPATLSPHTEADGVRHSALQFGESGRLFGVLSEPVDGPDTKLPAVVLLTGGAVPRTALNRSYVIAARDLAARGHAVFRMDASGVGESLQLPGNRDHDAYPENLIDDVGQGLRLLRDRYAGARFALVGLCSGAFAAFRAALEEPAVRSLVLISPLAFRWENPMPTDETPAQSLNKYLKAESGAGLRKKVVGLLKDPQRLASAVQRYSGVLTEAALDPVRQALKGKDPLGKDLRALAGRGVRMAVTFASTDPGYPAMLERAPDAIDKLKAAGQLQMAIVEGADHIFSGRSQSEALLEWMRPYLTA